MEEKMQQLQQQQKQQQFCERMSKFTEKCSHTRFALCAHTLLHTHIHTHILHV